MGQRIRWAIAWAVLGLAGVYGVPGASAVIEVPPPPTQQGNGNPGNPNTPGNGKPKDAPEPATLLTALVGSGALGLYAWRRRRHAGQAAD